MVIHIKGASLRLSTHVGELDGSWDAVSLYLFNGCLLVTDDGNKLLFMPMDLAGICIETVSHLALGLTSRNQPQTPLDIDLRIAAVVDPCATGVHLW